MIAKGIVVPGKRGVTADRIKTLADDIAESYRPGMDGAALAAALRDTRNWHFITTSIVIALDTFDTMIYEVLALHIRAWMTEYAIAPRYAPSTAIHYHNMIGIVIAVDPTWPGLYHVRLTHTVS